MGVRTILAVAVTLTFLLSGCTGSGGGDGGGDGGDGGTGEPDPRIVTMAEDGPITGTFSKTWEWEVPDLEYERFFVSLKIPPTEGEDSWTLEDYSLEWERPDGSLAYDFFSGSHDCFAPCAANPIWFVNGNGQDPEGNPYPTGTWEIRLSTSGGEARYELVVEVDY